MAPIEIEVEGVGIMRHCNDWQVRRIRRIADPQNRAIAWAAFGLGMTLQQFKKLKPDQQRAAMNAHNRLTSPSACAPASPAVPRQPRFPRRHERLSEAEMAELGRRLLQVKAGLPRGHFLPWIEEKSGISYGQAQRWMKAAREAVQEPFSLVSLIVLAEPSSSSSIFCSTGQHTLRV